MTALRNFLKKRILTEGPITVADYMADALGHPKYGYYITRDPLGADGDFTTAPEISQMFGEVIGLWLAENWRLMGAPSEFALVELGPGRGTLMADMLRAAKMQSGFMAAATIVLIETSPALRAKQKQALAGYNVTWGNSISDIPALPILLVANEFFDALPVRQLICGDRHWHERLVALDDEENLVFTKSPGKSAVAPLLTDDVNKVAKAGDIAEICLAGLTIAQIIGEHLAAHGGLALVIDYGYEESQPGDSLQALQSHEYIDPLATPGLADITTHVDFEALAKAFIDGGAAPASLISQGDFLKALGIETRAKMLSKNMGDAGKASLAGDLNRLIGRGEMGSLFKVLAITSKG